jgi:phosphoglycerate dehydrogenase-like enzyme
VAPSSGTVFKLGLTADLSTADGGTAFGGACIDGLGRSVATSFLPSNAGALGPADLAGFHGIVHFSGRVTEGSLQAATDLLVIARLGVGLDQIDLEACTRRGVLVSITPVAVSRPMAHGAIALLLALAHNIPSKERAAHLGEWGRRTQLQGKGVEGRVLGIVGFGRIGREIARLASPLGMQVLAYGPRLSPSAAAEMGVHALSLEQLLREADYICLCCPLNTETRGLLSRQRLALIRPDAYLVNVARGELVDQDALVEAIAQRRIAGAALDVFAPEPLPAEHPLLRLENVIITPHAVGYTETLLDGMMAEACTAVRSVVLGGLPEHVANPEVQDHPVLRRRLNERRSGGGVSPNAGCGT